MDFKASSQSTHLLRKQVGQLAVQWEGLLDLEVMTDIKGNEKTPQCNIQFENWTPQHLGYVPSMVDVQ